MVSMCLHRCPTCTVHTKSTNISAENVNRDDDEAQGLWGRGFLAITMACALVSMVTLWEQSEEEEQEGDDGDD